MKKVELFSSTAEPYIGGKGDLDARRKGSDQTLVQEQGWFLLLLRPRRRAWTPASRGAAGANA